MVTQDYIKDVLEYNPDTGVFAWKKPRGGKFAGTIAGKLVKQKSGYRYIDIKVNGKCCKAHRLAWLYMTGEWPEEIDHINRDSTDNRWINLRDVSHEENTRNRSRSSNNESGVNGVHWDTCKNRWRARVMLNGKSHYIGLFKIEDLDVAAMAVMEFCQDHGFCDGHGKDRPYR